MGKKPPLSKRKKKAVSAAVPARKALSPHALANLHPLLYNVNHEEVWGLIKDLPTRRLKKGEVLIRKDQANTTLYLVLSGRLTVNLDSPHGNPVAFIESGQAVGELSVIDHRPTSADVVAETPSRTLSIDEETFWRLIAVSHQFSKNMFLLLTQRLRTSNFTITENIRLRELLEHDANVDSLTGLRNRRWLDDNVQRFVERHQRSDRPLSLVMFDVDHFKKFNDTYGHAAGDSVLTAVGHAMNTQLRPSDFGVRYGGEEFTVICLETDLAGGFVAAERLRQKISLMPLLSIEGTTLPCVTVSLGVGQLNKNENAARFIKRVDDALYRAKNRGRNCTEPAWND
ncbi:MAG: GGDEF domain-containing protein [Chitinispirillaceae bacterium]|nr:GGDEF domain-containing protein [Chitinispirillaceae bacterium]